MNSKKILKIAAAVLLAIALIVLGYYLRGYMDQKAQKDAKSTAAAFVSAVERGNNSAAYELTGTALQKVQSQDSFNKYVQGLKSNKPVFENPEVYTKGSTVIYVQKVTGIPVSDTGRTDVIYTLNVAKEGGKWKVTAVAIR